MFYPVESLKKGGRFYFCWVADSWPLRFATITHRQLRSQDIRKICDELQEVMSTESGRPARRFSLRLSSQLMRGLVRLYQRKVNIFLSDLCMFNANVTKHVNQKFVLHDEAKSVPAPRPSLPRIVIVPPENEKGVEEMIQQSGNAVANVDEITLKEATLPDVQPMLNDNFGELHPDQPLQLFADKTLEVMLADQSAAQQSLELPLDFSAEKSHDKSRAAPDPQMEVIPENDVTVFKKSGGEELMAIDDIMKDVPEIPEIPEIPPPALPEPQPEIVIPEKAMEAEAASSERAKPVPEEPEIVLEELEDIAPQAKRRRVRGRIIDKSTQLSSRYMRARIDDVAVELRCQNGWEDTVGTLVPAWSLLRRPARAAGRALAGLFARRLGECEHAPRAHREMQEPMAPRCRSIQRLERIEERAEPPERPLTEAPPEPQPDLAELPTQLIDTPSQDARKRTLEREPTPSPKMRRRSGFTSARTSQQAATAAGSLEAFPDCEAQKENISDNIPEQFRRSQSKREFTTVTSMLQAAGLADLPLESRDPDPPGPRPGPVSPEASLRPRGASDGAETPLGSLDRTKVSLGDSERTTDSKKFIRDQWGTEGTMIKIIQLTKEGARPLNLRGLVSRGPVMAGYERTIIARCFTSVLKLKQHGFIAVDKDPITLEIIHIKLGAKFEQIV